MPADIDTVQALQAWLLATPHASDGGVTFVSQLVEQVRARGLEISRFSTNLLTKNPEVCWRTVQWSLGKPVTAIERLYDNFGAAVFVNSPVRTLRDGAACVRVKIGPGELPYPVCVDIRDAGGTDYYAQRLDFTTGETSFASWATSTPGGFTDAALATLDALAASLARRVELESAYHGTRALLEVYLGRNAAQRVVRGAFRRGEGETIAAAIWFCDLRGFTNISDRIPAEEVVRILDLYFDCVAEAITERGGEVLKFVGDAILAIFPVEHTTAREACERALAAAEAALAALAALSATRQAEAKDALAIGVALHLGSVMYGNIGSRQRLDFTVISAAVNEACRLEALCKELKTPLTMSEVFVEAIGRRDAVNLGAHSLKGVKLPVRVFTLPDYVALTGA